MNLNLLTGSEKEQLECHKWAKIIVEYWASEYDPTSEFVTDAMDIHDLKGWLHWHYEHWLMKNETINYPRGIDSNKQGALILQIMEVLSNEKHKQS